LCYRSGSKAVFCAFCYCWHFSLFTL